MTTAKATISFLNGTITFEGTEEFVREEVAKRSKSSKFGDPIDGEYIYDKTSPAELVATKRPKGHHEIVAVFAFLRSELGQPEFSEDDMRRLYLQARVRPPKVIGQALRDAKNKFDLIEGGEKRGTYKISPHGDRTVRYDLPRPGA